MPNPPAEMSEQSEPELREAALAKLRLGTNPFQLQVATVGTASESLLASVPEFAAGSLRTFSASSKRTEKDHRQHVSIPCWAIVARAKRICATGSKKS